MIFFVMPDRENGMPQFSDDAAALMQRRKFLSRRAKINGPCSMEIPSANPIRNADGWQEFSPASRVALGADDSRRSVSTLKIELATFTRFRKKNFSPILILGTTIQICIEPQNILASRLDGRS
jgi:hypothetical protein